MTVTIKGRTTIKGKTSTGFTPALDLNFTKSLASGLNPLDPRIQFSRTQTTATGSTVTGSDGKIRNAAHNILTYSEQFDNAAWTKNSTTVSANATTAPDGTSNADLFYPSTTGTFRYVGQQFTSNNTTTYTVSFYVKSFGFRWAYLFNNSGNAIAAWYDLQNGALGTVISGYSATITNVGNSWFRITLAGTGNPASSFMAYVGVSDADNTSTATASGTNGIYVWGAQVEQNLTASYYVPTTTAAVYSTPRFDYDPVTLAAKGLLIEEARTNIALQSSDIMTTWTTSGAFGNWAAITRTADQYTAPDGTLTGDQISGSGADRKIAQRISVIANTTYTFSMWVKTISGSLTLNIATGNNNVSVNAYAAISSLITSSDWQRYTVSYTVPASGVNQLEIGVATNGAGSNVAGVWGAQLEAASYASSYIPTTSASVTRNADIATIAGSDFSSFWTPITTNLLTYSEQFDNAAWNKRATTVSANVAIAPDGTLTADKWVETTATSDHGTGGNSSFSGSVVIGSIYTQSIYLKAGERSYIRFYDIVQGSNSFTVDLINGTWTTNVGSPTVSVVSVGNGWWRVSYTSTAGSASSALYFIISLNAAGTSINYAGDGSSGFYSWGAQAQTGTIATGYVPTVAASTAAEPDTLYVEFDTPASGNCSIIGIDDGTANNQIRMRTEGTDPYLRVAVGGVEQAAIDAGSVYTNYQFGMAAGVNANNFAASLVGDTAVTDTAGTYPTTVDRMRIGTDQGGAYLNGHVSILRMWKNRLANSILQSISFPTLTPALNLDFTAGSLDNRITFSRGTNATLTDSTGQITYAPANLLTYSDQYSNAVWNTTSGVTFSGQTATFTTTGYRYQTYNVGSSISGRTFIGSVTLSSASKATITIRMVGSVSGGTGTLINLTSTPTRYYVTKTFAVTDTSIDIGLDNRVAVGGDGIAGDVVVSGWQLEPVTYQTVPSTYVATTSAAYYGPRFDYSPITRACQGLLIEEARTNLVLQSNNFSTSWSNTNVAITASSGISPDGTNNAVKIEATGTATCAQIVSSSGSASGNTFSVYAKQGTGATTANRFTIYNSTTAANVLAITVNYSTGAITYNTGSSGASVINVGNGWWRIILSATTGISAGNTLIVYAGFVGAPATVGDYFLAYGAQLEAGSFATSYIPTTSATVARSADVASMTGSNFSSWYNQVQGTFVAKADAYSVTAYSPIVGARLSSTAIQNSLDLSANNGAATVAARFTVRVSGVTQADTIVGVPAMVPNTAYTFAGAFATNNFISASQGNLATPDTSGDVPAADIFEIGHRNSVERLNGHIASIQYYNQRLPNPTLQYLTQPSLVPSMSLVFDTSSNSYIDANWSP